MEDRSQEQREHIFAINGSPDFLNVIRDLFQDEGYNVTTTNFVPNSFEQIAALDPDALIVDIVVGQRAGGLMSWNPSLENEEDREDREGTGPEGSVERTQSCGDAGSVEGLRTLLNMTVFPTANYRVVAPLRH